ncbi:putative Ubiquitin Carboxyl-Terminal Hydrolase Faf-X, partial [Manis pentadactyla]
MSLLRAPTEIFCPLLAPLSPCPWDHQITVDPETPYKKILNLSATRLPLAPMQRGDREQWPLMELHPDTLTRAASPPADSRFRFRMSLLRAPTGDASARFSFPVSVSAGSPQILVSPLRPELRSGHRALGLCPVVSAVRGRGLRTLVLCPVIRDVLKQGPPAVCSSYHALGLYPLSLVLGRSGDTPQENTDSSAARLSPHANEGTGSSGRLMELCTPTPSRVRLHLFCGQPRATSSLFSYHALGLYPLIGLGRSGDTPQENTESSATRLGPHANGDREQWPAPRWNSAPRHPHACGFTSSTDSRPADEPPSAPTEIFCPASSLHCLRVLGIARSRLLDEPPSGPHRDLFCLASFHCLRVLGIACSRLLMSLLRPPQRSSARFSFHCLLSFGIASDHGRSGDTPQENTDLCNTSRPPCQRGTGNSGRLMELCTPTPSRVRLQFFLQTADFRWFLKPPWGPQEIFCPLFAPHGFRPLGIASITLPADDPFPPHRDLFARFAPTVSCPGTPDQ